MALVCELRFQGLVAVVASQTLKTTGTAEQLNVLLIDVAKSTMIGTLPPHLPVIEIPKHLLDTSVAPKSHHIHGYKRFVHQSHVYRLNGLRIRCTAGGASGGVVARHTSPSPPTPPTGSDWNDVEWLPDLEDIRGGGLGFIATSGLPVASQIELTNGTLGADSPSDARYGEVEFQFKSPSELVASRPPRYVTDRIRFVLPPTDNLAITLTPLRGGATHSINLSAPASADGHTRRATIFISNLPAMGAHMPMTALSDQHFAAFYDLIDPTISMDERPIPEMIDSLGVFGGSDGPIFCPPARMYTKS